MKSLIFSCFIILTFDYCISAQNLTIDYSSPKKTIRLNEYKDQWNVSVQSMEMIHPGGNSYQNFLYEEKKKIKKNIRNIIPKIDRYSNHLGG